MNCKLFLKNSEERLKWIKKMKKKRFIYDSFTDIKILNLHIMRLQPMTVTLI